MKKILVGLLALGAVTSAFANCLELYESKARKRHIVKKTLVRSGQVVGGAAGVVGLGSALFVSSGGNPYAYVFATAATGATVIAPLEASLQNGNRIERLLGAIKASSLKPISTHRFFSAEELFYKNDDVKWLVNKISKKMKFYTIEDEMVQRIKSELPIIISDMNQSKELCPAQNGKNEALSFNRALSSIVSKINQVFPNIDDHRSEDKSWTCTAQKDFYEGRIYSATANQKARAKKEARDLCELEENVRKCKKIISCENNLTGMLKLYGVTPHYLRTYGDSL